MSTVDSSGGRFGSQGVDMDLSLLMAITKEIVGTHQLQDLPWKVVEEVGLRLGIPYTGFALATRKGELVFSAAHGGRADHRALLSDGSRTALLPAGQGIAGRALRERHTQIVRDVSADRDYFAVPWLADTRVEVCIPVLRAGEVLGILDLQSPDPDAFPQDLVSKVESIAPLIGVAIETAGAISALEDSNRQLQLSEAVSRIVVGAANVSDLASRVAIKIREEFGVECVAVFRAQAREGALDLAGCASEPGFGGPLSTQARHGQGLVGRVAQSACALVFDSVVEPTREDALCSESQSELCVPLASTGRVAGVLHLASVVPRRFGPRDAQLLEAAAVPIAHAMASAVAMDRLEQLRNELSSMIVHDLRNPLMVVLTALRVLERVSAVQEDPRCQRYLRNASVAGDELLRMIGSLLDLQKLESGEINLQRTVFSLGDVVQRVVAGSQILAEVEEVDLDAEIASDLPPIKADLDLVLRTVENLVGNAVKFTPSGGRVRARVRRASREELASRSMTAGGGLLVDVVDSGEGIPEEDQERIFEKFGVVESRRRRVKVSTGLGLAMCKLVISAHKGSIWVESRPGAGARFVFILPLE